MNRIERVVGRRMAAGLALVLLPGALPVPAPETPRAPVVELSAAVLRQMNERFLANNAHWDELADLTTLEQMLGTIRPTQREYLGCLTGVTQGDTVRVTGWEEAHDLKQMQFAVDGSCDHVEAFLGTWHTHPYRADLQGRAVKERRLSAQDLATFAASGERVALVVWDADSIDAAVRRPGGPVAHPARTVIR